MHGNHWGTPLLIYVRVHARGINPLPRYPLPCAGTHMRHSYYVDRDIRMRDAQCLYHRGYTGRNLGSPNMHAQRPVDNYVSNLCITCAYNRLHPVYAILSDFHDRVGVIVSKGYLRRSEGPLKAVERHMRETPFSAKEVNMRVRHISKGGVGVVWVYSTTKICIGFRCLTKESAHRTRIPTA